MPIEEIPQLLEFNCIVEGMEDVKWNIQYDPNNKLSIVISGNAQVFCCPIELLRDIVDHLRQKNIIKGTVVNKPVPSQGFEQSSFASGLLPPKILGQQNVSSPSRFIPTSSMDPLSSFDISQNDDSNSLIEIPVINTPQPIKNNPDIGTIKTGNNVVPKSEIIARPVIRTRVNKNDPMSAEKEAAAIRGLGLAGSEKSIKKRYIEE